MRLGVWDFRPLVSCVFISSHSPDILGVRSTEPGRSLVNQDSHLPKAGFLCKFGDGKALKL